MPNGDTNYNLGGLNARMDKMEESVRTLQIKTDTQQEVIDKAIGGISIIKWAAGFLGISNLALAGVAIVKFFVQ